MSNETAGERIAKKRKELGLTQNKLAEMLIVSNKAVSKWESGLANPSFDLLPKLADILQCSIDYIVRGEKTYQYRIKEKVSKLYQYREIGIATLQQVFYLGFARAARLMDSLIENEYIEEYSPTKGGTLKKPKEETEEFFIKYLTTKS